MATLWFQPRGRLSLRLALSQLFCDEDLFRHCSVLDIVVSYRLVSLDSYIGIVLEYIVLLLLAVYRRIHECCTLNETKGWRGNMSRFASRIRHADTQIATCFLQPPSIHRMMRMAPPKALGTNMCQGSDERRNIRCIASNMGARRSRISAAKSLVCPFPRSCDDKYNQHR